MNLRNGVLAQVGAIEALGQLPVWVDCDADVGTPDRYQEIFGEDNQSGEYVLFAAGSYQRTDEGLLNQPTSDTEFRVEVKFDPDVVARERKVATDEMIRSRFTGLYLQEMRAQNLMNLAVTYAPPQETAKGLRDLALFGIGRAGTARDAGYGHGILRRTQAGQSELELWFVQIVPSDMPGGADRLMSVMARSVDPSVGIGAFVDQFQTLIGRYRGMPYRVYGG